MKLFYASLLLVLISNAVFAQKKLSKSRISSYYTFIYKLTDKEVVTISAKSKSVINDGYFHTLVDSFYTDKGYKKTLPFGNYIYVSANKEHLTYRIRPQNNVDLKFINNLKEFQFYITDLNGNFVKNANVEIGTRKNIKFDLVTNLYQASYPKKEQLIKVDHNGVSNFFTYDFEIDEKPKPYSRNKSYHQEEDIKSKKPIYNGYMVYSKPKYKPLDTLKFKAYVVLANGNVIKNKEVNVVLDVDGKDKTIGKLKPYKDGGYEYSFVLADSLNLRLDRNYIIKLEEKIKDKSVVLISNSFRYEDYELKALNFNVRTDKEVQNRNDLISIYMKAVDENDLTVPDGRVEIIAIAQNIDETSKNSVFVPDTLWKKEINLEPVGETKLVIPDSVFPNVSLNFNLNFNFRNSNNESRNTFKYLKYEYLDSVSVAKKIKSDFVSDSLYFDYTENNISVKQPAILIYETENNSVLDSMEVVLPIKIKVNYKAESYSIRLKNGFKEDVFISDFRPQIGLNTFHNKDSVRIVVDNLHKIPFWYTIFSNNTIIKKGYTINLDTLFKHSNSKSVHVRLNYYWDKRENNLEQSAYYRANLLTVKLVSPDVIYPGQKVNMLVKVTNADDKPVAETDVTAYASTSKFTNNYTPTLPYFGKSFKVRETKNKQFEEELISDSGNLPLNWERWSKQLELDTIEYFKFTNHKSIYKITENTNDTTTQVAPFAILDGKIIPVSFVSINDQLVYFDQVDQLNRYSFVVKPGVNNIKLRTIDKEIYLPNVEIEKGKKTILSIYADLNNQHASVINTTKKLSTQESLLLNNSLVKIENNFGEDKTIISTESKDILVNQTQNIFNKKDFLVGPFQENYLNIKNTNLHHTFIKEPGYSYTILPNLIKQKSYKSDYAFNPNFEQVGIRLANYTDYALKKNEIDSIWNDYLALRSRTTTLFINEYNYSKNAGRFSFAIDTAFTNRKPYIKNIFIFDPKNIQFLQIYQGNNTYYQNLNRGLYKVVFLFKDNSYAITDDILIKSNGQNYFYFKNLKLIAADIWSNKLDAEIKSVKQTNRYGGARTIPENILSAFNGTKFDVKTLNKTTTGTIVDEQGNPIPSATIKLYGANYFVKTDAEGIFLVKINEKVRIIISALGYESETIYVEAGNIGKIKLKASNSFLQEVMVVGYSAQEKKMLTGSVTNILSGKVAGLSAGASPIMLRGLASVDANKPPLYIVDGLPFSGDLKSVRTDDIVDMVILKDTDATAIYGSKAINGVIIIKTKKGNLQTNLDGALVSAEQSIRRNFNDEGFWQPKLITDENGTAKFTVTFPDDITNWKARVIAMNGQKQSGYTETFIKSFKSISANFVSPLFAVTGDSINVLGKLMNYTPLTETGIRNFKYNGTTLLNGNVSFKNSKIDTIPIFVNETDSLNFEYTLKQDNGYFDGELRKIPVYKAGVVETKGFFNALFADTKITYNFDKNLGKVSLRAEASIFPTLIDEMNKLRNYEYLCNEQLASKLKSLLLEKRVFALLEKPFNYDKDIKSIIKKLQLNRKPEGTWAWWQNGNEEMWISLHVVEALLTAQKDGYTVSLNKQQLYEYLVVKLANGRKYDQIHTIKLINLLDSKNYIKDWVTEFEKENSLINEKSTIRPSLNQQLEMLQLKQMAGIKINVEPYLKLKKETMFGAVYWGDQSYRFWDNSIQNTLLMYKILKRQGGYDAEMEKIVLYFLEQRKDGQWRNTYESSLILETILPQLLKNKVKDEPAYIQVNNKRIDKFPYDDVLDSNSEVKVKKGGKMAVYFTCYQQFINPKPEKVDKDFKVNTSFVQNGKTVSRLKAGELSTLKVEVEVRADADYVMIEIPIPAGCSYENKMQSFWGVETHREYFKNKTVIFSNKLKQGKYTFNIDLMPRYSGSYVLNPAKAEMMYFPVFYGREGMKKVGVN